MTGSATFYAYNGAIWNNTSAGTIDLQKDSIFSQQSGNQSIFNNAGTFTKSNGTTFADFAGFVFNNTGTVQVKAGTLSLGGGGTNTGSFSIDAGGTLRIIADYNFNTGNSVTGAGNFNIESGTTTVNVDSTWSAPVNLTGGNLTGTGALTISNKLNWSGGTLSGTGKKTVTGILNLSGDQTLDGTTLETSGATIWTGSSLYAGNGAIWNNTSTGTIDLQNDADFQWFWWNQTQTTFNNAGTFTKSNGTTTDDSYISGLFNNTGTVQIPILNDSLNEANETFTLNLASPINASLGTAKTATTTITDTLSASVTTTLPGGVENLTLTGTAAINGTGNANNNVFQGNSANNTLSGLDGNDTYRFLANTVLGTDTITETTTGGIDNLDFTGTTAAVNVNLGITTSQTVNSNLKLILSANNVIENATGGTGNDRLTGNALNNILNGGSGNDQLQGLGGDDILWGGLGGDILNGGTGNDQYRFQGNGVFSSSLGVDYITQFDAGQDKIALSLGTFNAITNTVGQSLTDFAVVSDDELVNASNARIVYSQSTGSLFYNQDGSILGTGTVFEFARLGNLDITLASSDFILIA